MINLPLQKANALDQEGFDENISEDREVIAEMLDSIDQQEGAEELSLLYSESSLTGNFTIEGLDEN